MRTLVVACVIVSFVSALSNPPDNQLQPKEPASEANLGAKLPKVSDETTACLKSGKSNFRSLEDCTRAVPRAATQLYDVPADCETTACENQRQANRACDHCRAVHVDGHERVICDVMCSGIRQVATTAFAYSSSKRPSKGKANTDIIDLPLGRGAVHHKLEPDHRHSLLQTHRFSRPYRATFMWSPLDVLSSPANVMLIHQWLNPEFTEARAAAGYELRADILMCNIDLSEMNITCRNKTAADDPTAVTYVGTLSYTIANVSDTVPCEPAASDPNFVELEAQRVASRFLMLQALPEDRPGPDVNLFDTAPSLIAVYDDPCRSVTVTRATLDGLMGQMVNSGVNAVGRALLWAFGY